MTTARFFRRDALLFGFCITGHAGYAESGSDIVCAAISALAQTCAIGLTEVLGLNADIQVDERSGAMSVNLPEDCIQSEGAQILLKTLFEGLKAIREQYPGYIQIINRERR